MSHFHVRRLFLIGVTIPQSFFVFFSENPFTYLYIYKKKNQHQSIDRMEINAV